MAVKNNELPIRARYQMSNNIIISTEGPDRNRMGRVYLASALFFITFAASMKTVNVGIMDMGHPSFEGLYLVRTALIILSSWFFVAGIVRCGAAKGDAPPMPAEGAGGRKTNSVFTGGRSGVLRQKAAVWAVLLLSSIFTLVFFFDIETFTKWGYEDGPVEYLSAVFCFLACFVFATAFLVILRKRPERMNLYLGVTLLMASCLFLAGMEEVSWFQRVLELDTPNSFHNNLQNEINLHNFDTLSMNNAYYMSAFILLIMAPLIKDKTEFFSRVKEIDFFVPGLFVLFAGAVFTTYNYQLWENLFLQMIFFVTIFVLLHYAMSTGNGQRWMLSAMIVLSLLTQSLLLARGDYFGEWWIASEYKELFIPLVFLIYSLDIFWKSSKMRRRPRKEHI